MHKKKKHTTSTVSLEHDPDKIAFVKAAAWAWHQRSCSPKNKRAPPPEFPSASPRCRSSHRQPSRYRLESLSKSSNSSNDHQVPEKTPPITLLDIYEIERITRELDQRLAAVSTEKREKVQGRKVAQMRKGVGGGCLFGRAVMICVSPDTAAGTEGLVGRRRREIF